MRSYSPAPSSSTTRRVTFALGLLDAVAEGDRADRLAVLRAPLQPGARGVRLACRVLVVAVAHQRRVHEPHAVERLRVLDGAKRHARPARPQDELDQVLRLPAVAACQPVGVLHDHRGAQLLRVGERPRELRAAVAAGR